MPSEVPTCQVSATLAVLTYDVSYMTGGDFTMTVSAYNYVSTVTDTSNVDVINVINDLVLSGDDTILTPPGTVTCQVTTEKSFESIDCVWNMASENADAGVSFAVTGDPETGQVISFFL